VAKIKLKRIYEPATPDDGTRILVDRIWPRGISKEAAALAFWSRETAPSDELRQWYRHAPDKAPEFRRRYFAELDAHPQEVASLVDHLGKPMTTFVFASKEGVLHNARALKEYLEQRKLA
jgi:uncharacterized protein YeaO (DUF488 family)